MKLTPKKVDKLLAQVQEQLKLGYIKAKEFDMNTYEGKKCSVDGEHECKTTHCISGWMSVVAGLTTEEGWVYNSDIGRNVYSDKILPYGGNIVGHEDVEVSENLSAKLRKLFNPPSEEGEDRGHPIGWNKYKRKHAIRAIELFREGDPDPWVTVNQEIRAKEI